MDESIFRVGKETQMHRMGKKKNREEREDGVNWESSIDMYKWQLLGGCI